MFHFGPVAFVLISVIAGTWAAKPSNQSQRSQPQDRRQELAGSGHQEVRSRIPGDQEPQVRCQESSQERMPEKSSQSRGGAMRQSLEQGGAQLFGQLPFPTAVLSRARRPISQSGTANWTSGAKPHTAAGLHGSQISDCQQAAR